MITKKIVELHEGTVAVASTVGVGTTFTLRIPLRMQTRIEHDGDNTSSHDGSASVSGTDGDADGAAESAIPRTGSFAHLPAFVGAVGNHGQPLKAAQHAAARPGGPLFGVSATAGVHTAAGSPLTSLAHAGSGLHGSASGLYLPPARARPSQPRFRAPTVGADRVSESAHGVGESLPAVVRVSSLRQVVPDPSPPTPPIHRALLIDDGERCFAETRKLRGEGGGEYWCCMHARAHSTPIALVALAWSQMAPTCCCSRVC